MTARKALLLYFLLLLVFGAASGYFTGAHRLPPKELGFALMLGTTATLYCWYYLDAAEQKFQRTSRLGSAMILIMILAIPYYLVRSRPPGRKLRALLKFAGLIILSLATVLFGEFVYLLLLSGT